MTNAPAGHNLVASQPTPDRAHPVTRSTDQPEKGDAMTTATKPPSRIIARLLPGASLALIGSLIALGGGGVLAALRTNASLPSGPHLLSTPPSAVAAPL